MWNKTLGVSPTSLAFVNAEGYSFLKATRKGILDMSVGVQKDVPWCVTERYNDVLFSRWFGWHTGVWGIGNVTFFIDLIAINRPTRKVDTHEFHVSECPGTVMLALDLSNEIQKLPA
jgi:hypothetical protein